MKEKIPSYIGEAGNDNHESGARAEKLNGDSPEIMELAAARQFILDSAPKDWEAKIDEYKLLQKRRELLALDTHELLRYAQSHDLWEDATFAQALSDVIASKITPVL